MGIRGAGFKSITAQFLTRGRKNVYWGKFSKKEKAITTDIAGRKLRTKNYHSPRVGLVGRDTLPFFRRTPKTVRRAPSSFPGFRSATRTGRSWSGDISGQKIRRSTAKRNKEVAGKFVFPRKMSISAKMKREGIQKKSGFRSATKSGRVSTGPIPGKAPGLGAQAYHSFSRLAKPKQTISGLGGSSSGKSWNNKNQPLPKKPQSLSSYFSTRFSGTAKAHRPQQGGGSISGKLWNNHNQPIDVNKAGRGTIQASQFKGRSKRTGAGDFNAVGLDYTGQFKARKPVTGGGSISGKLWNNNNQPVDVNRAGQGTIRASKYQGTAKVRRPEKGGGSISGKMWNNNNQPVDVNRAGKGTIRASQFQGTAKIRRPEKGGGSISGKMWNNNNQPVDVIQAGKGTVRASKFQGNIKGVIPGPALTRLGLNYDGDYKRSKKGIDNKETSVMTKLFKPNKSGALPATHLKRDEKEGHYVHFMKQYWDYKHNPNTSKQALKLREPGKANARVGDLQVNIKMKKYTDHNLHPDAQYAHGFRNNVKEERTVFMNIKLTWAKLFKKSDNQPRGLKQKPTKPRYDPNEKGMWYD